MGNQNSSDYDSDDDDVEELLGILRSSGCKAITIPQRQPQLDKKDEDQATCCVFCFKRAAVHAFIPCGCRVICNHCACRFPEISDEAVCIKCKNTINQIA